MWYTKWSRGCLATLLGAAFFFCENHFSIQLGAKKNPLIITLYSNPTKTLQNHFPPVPYPSHPPESLHQRIRELELKIREWSSTKQWRTLSKLVGVHMSSKCMDSLMGGAYMVILLLLLLGVGVEGCAFAPPSHNLPLLLLPNVTPSCPQLLMLYYVLRIMSLHATCHVAIPHSQLYANQGTLDLKWHTQQVQGLHEPHGKFKDCRCTSTP